MTFKSETKRQSQTSGNIFKAFSENDLIDFMRINFNQESGECEYTYVFKNSNSAYYILVDSKGIIIQSGFTTK
jgi:hypothetical protein